MKYLIIPVLVIAALGAAVYFYPTDEVESEETESEPNETNI